MPVEEARKMMNCEEENFMKQHLKLKYTEGDMWIFLKATTKEDSEAMLTVNQSTYIYTLHCLFAEVL